MFCLIAKVTKHTCGFKYPAKGIYEIIYDNRTVRVPKKEFDRVWRLTDPELNSRGG